jgi:hypothetical protein
MADTKISALTSYSNPDAANDVIPIVDTANSSTKKITRNAYLGLTSTPVGLTDTQVLTNKTLTAPTLTSPILSGTVTGTYTLAGTPTFPSSVVTLTGSQTLTNKILTSPTISAPTITNASISADAITGFSSSNSGTIYGVAVSSGIFTTNNIVPNNSLSNTGSFGSAWAYTSWVPAWTNFTVGNGTLNYAKFSRVGASVRYRLKFTLGSTSAVTGLITFSTPVNIHADYAATDLIPGSSTSYDLSAATLYFGQAFSASSSTISLKTLHTDGTRGNLEATASNNPFVWTTGDIIYSSGMYEGV